ncbi:heavy-metal-associated domain-containing protein [Candidatus Wolfebacteria bacterium]|nr:heavy-metal-associated domain-containing protein [Candidatus Wolfebacteria bacterium]
MIQIKKYSIEGMNCGSCAVSIEMLLANQAGVKSAKVNFDDKEAAIEFDDAQFNFVKVGKIINQMGYTLTEK